jgi:hypothetical protein
VILASVNLPDHPAHPRTVVSQEHKQILHNESILGKFVDNFHVRQPLLVGADLISTLDDVYALIS